MKHPAAIHSRIAILAALVLTGGFSQSRPVAYAATGADSQDWSHTVTKPVTDPALNMTAFTVTVPAGWKFTGMLERIPGCHGTLVPADGLAFTALAPDGVTAIEKLPGTSWGWASDGTSGLNPKCGPVKISTADEYLLNIAIPNLRPDAQHIAVVPFTPEMKDMLAKARQQGQAQAPQGMKITEDAARVRLQYTLKGHPVEELLFVTLICREIDTPAFPMLHRPASQRHICSSPGTAIRRAPQGKLDPLIGKALPPPQINNQWDQEISEQMRQQFAAIQKRSDDTFRAIQNHFKEVDNQMRENHEAFMAQQQSSFNNAMAQDRATQGAIDHAAQMQVRDSLNRQDFIDPNTGRKIETSNQFTHNWISSDGQSVVLNRDPTLDPNGLVDPVRQSWTELIPVN
jgi:hypothetical protein